MAKLPASTRADVVTAIAASEAELTQYAAEAATAQASLDQATRRRGRAERQLGKLKDMLAWIDDVNNTTGTG